MIENNNKLRLFNRVKQIIRVKLYSLRTEEIYINWIKWLIYFHKRNPIEMERERIWRIYYHLTDNEEISSSTQNQALYVIVFLYNNARYKIGK